MTSKSQMLIFNVNNRAAIFVIIALWLVDLEQLQEPALEYASRAGSWSKFRSHRRNIPTFLYQCNTRIPKKYFKNVFSMWLYTIQFILFEIEEICSSQRPRLLKLLQEPALEAISRAGSWIQFMSRLLTQFMSSADNR